MESIKSDLFDKFKFDKLDSANTYKGGLLSSTYTINGGPSRTDSGKYTKTAATDQYGNTNRDIHWEYFIPHGSGPNAELSAVSLITDADGATGLPFKRNRF